jgi:hypothetical protein
MPYFEDMKHEPDRIQLLSVVQKAAVALVEDARYHRLFNVGTTRQISNPALEARLIAS